MKVTIESKKIKNGVETTRRTEFGIVDVGALLHHLVLKADVNNTIPEDIDKAARAVRCSRRVLRKQLLVKTLDALTDATVKGEVLITISDDE